MLAIFLLPAIFYPVYEFSTLDENEQMIEQIYVRQLDAILYSLNQYSQDYVSSWAEKVNRAVPDDEALFAGDSTPEAITGFLYNNFAIQYMFFADSSDPTAVRLHYVEDDTLDEKAVKAEITNLLVKHKTKINRLYNYRSGGFRKIEPLYDSTVGNNLMPVVFLLDDANQGLQLCGMVINPTVYVEEVLSPKMQEVAQDGFVLAAFLPGQEYTMYNTVNRNDQLQVANLGAQQTKGLWPITAFSLGIAQKGTTLKEVVRQRTYTNLAVIAGIGLVLLVAIWLVYRNIKKQIDLAQAKSDFVSNVSHEIRTPLSLISMFAETLMMGRVRTEDKKQEYYAIISKETTRLAGIINRILNFSQMEANKKTFEFKPVNPYRLAEEVLQSYKFHLTSKGFTYSLDGDRQALINADQEAVEEAFINLLDNGIKYSRERKEIQVTIGRAEGKVYIEVKDYGIGISKKDQKHIFDKFYRVASGPVHNTKGTGLGLSLVKQIIDAHKGNVAITSELGQGSAFRMVFPAVPTASQQPAEPDVANVAPKPLNKAYA